MAKGYDTLVDPNTKVDVHTGLIAAGRLQAMIESRASGTSMVDILVKMDKIINAIKSTVPEEMWEEIAAKLDEPIAVGPPADELEEGYDAKDEYDRMDPATADEKCWNPCQQNAALRRA